MIYYLFIFCRLQCLYICIWTNWCW